MAVSDETTVRDETAVRNETTVRDETAVRNETAESASATARRQGRGPEMLAALWGFAESTLFFIVPDVLLTWLALSLPRRALRACYWALAGALAGAVVMIGWAGSAPRSAEAALLMLPGISPELLELVRGQLVSEGLPAILMGPVQGFPFKTYVVEATVLGFSPWTLLAVSVPARMLRFLLLTLFAIGLARGPLRRLSTRTLRILHVVAWTVFYVVYFIAIQDPLN
jgi:membrane protein YqaA with SNARE-associated domain